MKILLDVMGGDHCPTEAIKGAVTALKKIESDIVLIGKEELIKEEIKKIYGTSYIDGEDGSELKFYFNDGVLSNIHIYFEKIK